MLRSTRAVFQRGAIRPVAQELRGPVKDSFNQAPSSSKSTQFTPIGLAAILGGLALGTYFLKPSKAVPAAAMDNFKPKVAIIFALGDSHGTFKKSAPELGFEYINIASDLGKLDSLVKQGTSRFFIEGFANEKDYERICQDVVNPDLVLDFGSDATHDAPRIMKLEKSADTSAIADILKQRNFV